MTSPVLVRSDGEPVDPSLVQLFISETTIREYVSVALMAVLVHHSLLTLDEEVRYFWSNPWNSVSTIYFANRFIGLLGAICSIVLNTFQESLMICQFSAWTQGVANLLTIVLIDYILVIRVLALYHQNTLLGICLKVVLALEAIVDLGLLIYGTFLQEISAGSLSEATTICGDDGSAPEAFIIISWTLPMAFGLILLLLTLCKAAEYWRMSNGFKGFHLVAVLVQDQVVYYGFVIFCSVLPIVVIRIFDVNPFVAEVLNVVGSPTLLCILGSQLLINLKEAGERGANGGMNYRTESVSEIQFA